MQEIIPQLELPPYIPFYSHGLGWQIAEITNSDRCEYVIWTPQAFEGEYGGDAWESVCDAFIKISSDYEIEKPEDKYCDCWLWGYCLYGMFHQS